MRLAWWDGKRRTLVFDVLFAGLVASGLVLEIANNRELRWYTFALVAVPFTAMIVRRRFPLLFMASTPIAQWWPSVQVTIAAYTVASRKGLHWQTAVSFLYGSAVIVVWPGKQETTVGSSVGYVVFFVLVPTLLGLWVYQRRALLVALRDRAEQAERERDLRAERVVVAERRRIAREMHDVVAHRVSAIALQSGALTMTAPDKQTEEVAEVIRKTSTAALTELRDILQVLRDDLPGEPGHVAPALDAVPVLVADAVGTGLKVDLQLPDPIPDVDPAAGRAAYRVVQEALTNATKHAPGVVVTVRITADEQELVVEVTNPRGVLHAEVPGSGYGLMGMRERVSLAGGTLQTGWSDDGVFRVRAVLPTKATE
ncbi:sensor histidine kinase [Kribbella sandramycini]|uniref:histidine kinase n=1 Tax=Kribbella sandramycini TaxID=60450 RepID=A0A7Y4KWM7_9ACTN|nr:histidine kinase [Kribbella sandramycini]MBB6567420.1 signal transduction histidine kinase [Kribbella sandramycini]NOL39969.1 sensor histidine kinase [Kribbella sandramycini]